MIDVRSSIYVEPIAALVVLYWTMHECYHDMTLTRILPAQCYCVIARAQ